MITGTYRVSLDGTGPVDVTVSEYGEGRPILLLHGGGPDTVARFGDTLAAAEIAILNSPRVSRAILIGAAGLEVPVTPSPTSSP